MVFLRNISVDTLHKGDTEDNLLLLLSLPSLSSSSVPPLCRVSTLIFLRQTMSLGNTVLQLFWCNYSWCVSLVPALTPLYLYVINIIILLSSSSSSQSLPPNKSEKQKHLHKPFHLGPIMAEIIARKHRPSNNRSGAVAMVTPLLFNSNMILLNPHSVP